MTVDRPSGPFRIGDRVQLTGPKNRLHTIKALLVATLA